MDVEWIEEVMRLNARAVAAEVSIRVQVARIMEMTEERRNMSGAEWWLIAAKKNLRLLRKLRDTMLDGIQFTD
jgi:hypothetical protein